MKSKTFQRAFLLILVTIVSLAFLMMISDFLIPLLFAAIFSGLVRPFFTRFLRWTRGRKGPASALTLLTFVLLIALPAFGFVGLVATQAVKVTQDVTPWVQENLSQKDLNNNVQRLPGYKYFRPYRRQIVSRIGTAVSGMGNAILKGATAFTTGTLLFFVNFAIMLYAMFFFLIDGPVILNRILYLIPLDAQDEKKLVDGFQSMARATIKGLVVIGAVQGTLAGLSFWMAGIPSPLFWGTVMAVLSAIPNIGSALIWIPGCIYLFVHGNTVGAIAVFAWCAFIVGSADNVLRPILVGKGTQVHELLILISTLGGLAMFGLAGFILGPVLALLFMTVWNIYGETFKDVLPDMKDALR